MLKQARKLIKWVSSAKRDLDAMPEDVKDVFGHTIDLAQAGGKHQDTKVLTGSEKLRKRAKTVRSLALR